MSKLELRELQFRDIFTMSRIAGQMGFKFDVKKVGQALKDATTEKEAETAIGYDMAAELFCNLQKAEKEVTEFLADLTGLKAAELKKMELADLVEVYQAFKESRFYSVFFSSLSR